MYVDGWFISLQILACGSLLRLARMFPDGGCAGDPPSVARGLLRRTCSPRLALASTEAPGRRTATPEPAMARSCRRRRLPTRVARCALQSALGATHRGSAALAPSCVQRSALRPGGGVAERLGLGKRKSMQRLDSVKDLDVEGRARGPSGMSLRTWRSPGTDLVEDSPLSTSQQQHRLSRPPARQAASTKHSPSSRATMPAAGPASD